MHHKGTLLVLGAVGLYMYYHHQKKQKAKLRPAQQQIGYSGPQGQQPANHHYGAAIGGAALAGGALYYGSQHMGGGGGGGSGAYTNVDEVLRILKETVRDQKLSGFYHGNLDHHLRPIAEQVVRSGAIDFLAREWDLPHNIAVDFCKLALFDVILYLDDSGSMSFEEGGRRIQDMKLIVHKVAEVAAFFDTNGIQVRFINSHIEGNNIRNEQSASALIDRLEFKYQTAIGTSLKKKILDPLVIEPAKHGRLAKPVYIITVTDGEPQGEARGTLAQVIEKTNKELKKTKYGSDAVSFQLAQVGTDRQARDFLSEIDTHGDIGHLVDVTSNYEYEAEEMARGNPPIQLTAILWLVKICLGGVDSSMDGSDERGGNKMKSRLAVASAHQDYAWADDSATRDVSQPYGQQTSPPPAAYGQPQYPPPNQGAYPPQGGQQYPPPGGQYLPPGNQYPPPGGPQQGYGQPQAAYGQPNYPPPNTGYPQQSGGYPQQSGGGYPQQGGYPDPNAVYGGNSNNNYGGGGYPSNPPGYPAPQQQQQGNYYQQPPGPPGGGYPQGNNQAWVPSMPNPGQNQNYGGY